MATLRSRGSPPVALHLLSYARPRSQPCCRFHTPESLVRSSRRKKSPHRQSMATTAPGARHRETSPASLDPCANLALMRSPVGLKTPRGPSRPRSPPRRSTCSTPTPTASTVPRDPVEAAYPPAHAQTPVGRPINSLKNSRSPSSMPSSLPHLAPRSSEPPSRGRRCASWRGARNMLAWLLTVLPQEKPQRRTSNLSGLGAGDSGPLGRSGTLSRADSPGGPVNTSSRF